MVLRTLRIIRGLFCVCRHREQMVTSHRLSTGGYEMFLVCAGCSRRVSKGVVLDRGTVSPASHPARSF
ncbi:MAG TPA: hypothetical protein VFA76_04255 [Terriglobales bacterium]|nr:hypothetical protein [Terriglobales bacterium]